MTAPQVRPWQAIADLTEILPLCIILCALFILLKSSVLRRAAQAWEVPLGRWAAVRLFCESAVVELISWPGKLWSDAYKYALMGSSPIRARLAALVTARLAALLAGSVIFLVSISVLSGQYELGWWRPVACTLLLVWLVLRRVAQRQGQEPAHRVRWSRLALLPSLAGLATIADVTAMALIAHRLAGIALLEFAAWYVIISAVGALSTIPLGLGVLDAACWVTLTGLFGVRPHVATLIVIWYRLLGPFLTLLFGSLSLLGRCLGTPRSSLAPKPLSPAVTRNGKLTCWPVNAVEQRPTAKVRRSADRFAGGKTL